LKPQSCTAKMEEVRNETLISWYLKSIIVTETQKIKNKSILEPGPSNQDLSTQLSTHPPVQHDPASTKKLLMSGYVLTLTILRQTVSNIYKSDQLTTIPSLSFPSSQAQQPLLRITNESSHEDATKHPEVTQAPNEVTAVRPEHGPTVTIPEEIPSYLLISAQWLLEQADDLQANNQWKKHSIYRVPKTMRREANKKSYTPQMVSIGPFHHGRKELADIEQHKCRAMQQVLKRTGHDIKLYIDAIKPLANLAWWCYEGKMKMPNDEFVLSLVLLQMSYLLLTSLYIYYCENICISADM
jgi:Plant protein of unknown function